jgi:hypothetical protein
MRTRSTLLGVSLAVLLASGAIGCGNGDDNSSPVPIPDAGGSDATHSEGGSSDAGLPDGTTAGDGGSAEGGGDAASVDGEAGAAEGGAASDAGDASELSSDASDAGTGSEASDAPTGG